MTMPTAGGGFTLVPDGLQALADELVVLSLEVAERADSARSAGRVLGEALDGDTASAAADAANAWGALEELLADRTRAVAGILRAAVAAYLAEDLALSGRVGPGGRPPR